MKFSHIDARLTPQEVEAAKYRFNWLLTELGLRESNYHVGTGLGGNNFQLMVLLSFKHTLVKRNVDIQVDDKRVAWSADWLINTPKRTIRSKLDETFYLIAEKHKYLAIALAEVADSFSMKDTVRKYPEQFPQLLRAISNKDYSFDKDMPYTDQLIVACIMCQELSARLDAGDRSTVQSTGSALNDFPTEIILLSVRRHIQIERLVRHNLDEDPVFMKTLMRVNKVVDR
jgi:hypothetical protein